jgi:hypothetical protein
VPPRGFLALAESSARTPLLLVGRCLTVEDQHGVFVHAGLDVDRFLLRQRLAQIDTETSPKNADEAAGSGPSWRFLQVAAGGCFALFAQKLLAAPQVNARRAARISIPRHQPPSTGITAPVRNDAAGRHRLSVMCATSSGSP